MGFLLALLTAFMWGVLPIFLKLLLEQLNAVTITSTRFLFAGIFMFVVLSANGALPKAKQSKGIIWVLFGLTTLLLLVNYVTNVIALAYVSPATVQLVMQLAPFLLMVGGVVFYKEVLSPWQLFGALILFLGLGLFFNQRIPVIMASTEESIVGVWITAISAVAWAGYALAQKKLLVSFTVKQLTLLIYVFGALVLLPFSDFTNLINLTSVQWWSLLFCCINTLIGYGAFTQALQIWEASKVSAVITIAPIFTYISNKIALEIAPDIYINADMDLFAYVGASMIIFGAMLAALAKPKQVIVKSL